MNASPKLQRGWDMGIMGKRVINDIRLDIQCVEAYC